MITIHKFFLRMIITRSILLAIFNLGFFLKKNFFSYLDFTLLAHHLSKIKYQTELAIGSTIASVKATAKDTSAISIKTVIAIIKWPIV